jgi:hypothetical protein
MLFASNPNYSDDDDLDLFQSTIPHYGMSGSSSPITPPDSSIPSPQSYHPQNDKFQRAPSPSSCYSQTTRLFAVPVQLGVVCRKVHSVLTGPKASRRAEEHGLVDAHGMREIWEDLDHCWREFDSMRRRNMNEQPVADVEQFTSAWQVGSFIASHHQDQLTGLDSFLKIFIFECRKLFE